MRSMTPQIGQTVNSAESAIANLQNMKLSAEQFAREVRKAEQDAADARQAAEQGANLRDIETGTSTEGERGRINAAIRNLQDSINQIRNTLFREMQGSANPALVEASANKRIAEAEAMMAKLAAELKALPAFQTRPGEYKVVPGPSNKSMIAQVHGGEIIARSHNVVMGMGKSVLMGGEDLRRFVVSAVRDEAMSGGFSDIVVGRQIR
jgi:hypothetical protein